MTELFINTFTETAVAIIPMIPYFIAFWLLFDLIGGLLFDKR